MPDAVLNVEGVVALHCATDGPAIDSERAATDLIGDAFGYGAELVIVPVERLSEEFFALRTRTAGDVIQKFVTYRVRLAIVGDITRHLDASEALRAFVGESNRGRAVWFVPDLPALERRLAASA